MNPVPAGHTGDEAERRDQATELHGAGDLLAPRFDGMPHRRLRYLQAAVYGLIAAGLMVALAWAIAVARSSFRTVALGEADVIFHSVRASQHQLPGPLEMNLDRVLRDHRSLGLGCLAVLSPDRRVRGAAGDCPELRLLERVAAEWRPGDLWELGSGFAVIRPLLSPRRPPAGRRPPPPRFLLVGFEPVRAVELIDASRWSFVVGSVATGALVVAIAVFWRMSARVERQQRELEQDRLLASLGEMSAVLVHEVRNPLASLKGHAQVLLEDLGDGDPKRSQAEWVVREAARLEQLCEDLLGLVRSGGLRREGVDPVAILREAAQAVGAGRARLDTAAAPRRWSLDPLRMHEVLVNLIRNAVQASPADATVLASVASRDGALEFVVRDRGEGVAEGDAQHIFEPFRTGKSRGTGLGLAVARRIVEMHGGTIAVRNHPAGGAEFRVVLPAGPTGEET